MLCKSRPSGRLAENILHFARALRSAGLPVGPGRAVAATEAVMAVGPGRREDFYWALHASFISRAEHRAVFDAAFQLFWRDPQLREKMMSVLLRETRAPSDTRRKAGETRAAEAMAGAEPPPIAPPRVEDQKEIKIDATLTFSAEEKLKRMDFEQMTAAELAAARQAIAKLRLPAPKLISRRAAPNPRGRKPDWRAAMRAGLRDHGLGPPPMRAPRHRPPDLVALCDISGSMSGYSRMLLHFLHAVGADPNSAWGKSHSFVFGTRLSNVTRHLQARDVDDALAAAGAEVEDWEGGTRIGRCLAQFNRDWSRRVLGRGAVVLLITDGLDRDDPELLAASAERLRLSCRKLIWLCPLLRWDGFAPKAQGVRALLPLVDSFRAAHNIESLEALAAALSRPDDNGALRRFNWEQGASP